MTKIQIDLPQATAQAARDAGLLTPAAVEQVFIEAIRRRQAAQSFLSLAEQVAAAGIEEM
jgi:hypothetical protein